MKLLARSEAQASKKRENDALVESTLRLSGYHQRLTKRLANIKDDYSADKLARLREYEQFCKDLNAKREKLLKELSAIESIIEEKKEIYYGLIEKQDALEDKAREIKEENEKLDLREKFVLDLEEKWRNKQ